VAPPTLIPVVFDDEAINHDLQRLPATARDALDALKRDVAGAGGIPATRVRRCDPEARDGTRLPGCAKTYVPWGEDKWGLVFAGARHPTRPFALRAFAYGVRHPMGTTPSVYEIAHRRLNAPRHATTETIDED